MTWRVHIEDQPWRLSSRIRTTRDRQDGGYDVVLPLTLQTVEAGLVGPENDGLLGEVRRPEAEAFLQSIMNAAWEIGIRPTEFTDHTNELTATRYHLEDMRSLALKDTSVKSSED